MTCATCPDGHDICSPNGECPVPACTGDCDANGTVEINEIIQCVSIALSNSPVSACAACDANGDGQVEINEIIAAVNNALNGCASR